MKTQTAVQFKSQKGKRNGKVGAPPKPVTFPKGSFTLKALFTRNNNQCELSLRNKVTALLKVGKAIQLASKKQPNGAVGRPEAVYVLKENFNKETMTRFGQKAKASAKSTTKTTRKTRANVVAPATPAAPVETNTEMAPEPVTAAATPTPAPAEAAAPAAEPVIA